MPQTRVQIILAVQRWLRQHPSASDDDVMGALGLHPFDRELITVARQNLAADQSEKTDLGGTGFHPGL